MKYIIAGTLVVVALAGCGAVVRGEQPPPAPRTVAATVTATSTAGTAIGSVPLRRFEPFVPSAGLQGGSLLLSTTGSGVLSLPCQASEATFGVALTAHVSPSDPQAASFPDEDGHFKSLVGQFAFLQYYSVSLSSTATAVTLGLSVRPATTADVTIRVDGTLRSGSAPVIEAVGYVSDAKATGIGVYRVSGVPQGVPYDLCILDGNRVQFTSVAAHTDNLAIPEIAFNTAAETVSLDAKLARPAGTADAQGKTAALSVITLLRTDGSGGYEFYRGDKVGMTGTDRLRQFAGGGPETGWKPNIKPGEYWVLPRAWLNLPREVAFRQMVVAGKDVTAAGLPKITAVAGQPVSITLDADQMLTTFEAFTTPLLQHVLPVTGPNPPNYVPAAP